MKRSAYTFLWNDYQPHRTIEGNIIPMQKLRSIKWNQINNIIQVSWDNMIYCYHSTKDLENDKERGKLFFNKAFVKKTFKEIDRDYQKQWKIFNILGKSNFKNHSNKELFNLFHKSMIHWGVMISYFRMTQAEGTHYLVEKLKKPFSDEESTILMTPTEPNLANKEMLDWYKILKKPFSKKLILKHVEKYPWVVISHFSYDDVIETLSQRYEYDKKHPQKYDFVNEKKKIKEKQKHLLKKHPELRDMVKLMQKLAVYRMNVKSCWGGIDFYLIPLLKEISSRTGENPVDIHKYYLIDDVYQLLLHGEKLSEKEKANRKVCFVGLWKNGKSIYVSGKKAEKLAEKELKELYRIKKIKELKGTIAHPGIIKGKVRILPTNNIEVTRHLRRTFQKGEILITGMTQPNIMDIASKAGAIVTDEGGMLSHAAIISREFKIPCIVGTHFATQVFNEGEQIEVDANKGIVRKIKW